MKRFFIRDLSGRGYSSNQTETEIRKNWDIEDNGPEGISLDEWLENAEVGDQLEIDGAMILRTE